MVKILFKVWVGPFPQALGVAAGALWLDGFTNIVIGTEHIFATALRAEGGTYVVFERVQKAIPWIGFGNFSVISVGPDEVVA